jgi:cathepsin B
MVLVISTFITVGVFLFNGKCPGKPGQQKHDPYEKAITEYANLQETKLEKRLNKSRGWDKEFGDDELAEWNSRRLVREINKRNSTYTVRFNPSATGMQKQKLMSDRISENTKVSNEIYQAITEMLNLVKMNGPFHDKYVKHLRDLYARIEDGIPLNFLASDKWPDCDIKRVYDQGGCGSCWALAAASVISDRICIKSGGENVRLSPQKLIECCPFCGGCNGSVEPLMPFYYYYESGLVTETCYPYTVKQDCGHPCKLETFFQPKGVCNCSSTCSNGKMERRRHAEYVYKIGTVNGNTSTGIMSSLSNTYKAVKDQHGWRSVEDIMLAKVELMQNGPFTLCFRVFEGFLHYYKGVYKVIEDLETLHIYDHCVKTIGWGIEEDGREYFVGVNSWGEWGGLDGTFKIDMKMLAQTRGDMYGASPNLDY